MIIKEPQNGELEMKRGQNKSPQVYLIVVVVSSQSQLIQTCARGRRQW